MKCPIKINIYYVYEWIRLDTNEPFYVGKGKGDRWRKLTRKGNQYFNNIVNNEKNIPIAVNILYYTLDEKIAYDIEVYYIWLYRDIIGYNLVNITDGGEGGNYGGYNKKGIYSLSINDELYYQNSINSASLELKINVSCIKAYHKGEINYTKDINKNIFVHLYEEDCIGLQKNEIKEILEKYLKNAIISINNKSEKLKESWENKTEKEKEDIKKKIKNTIANRTKKEQEKIRKKMSENHADFSGENHPQKKMCAIVMNGKILKIFKYSGEVAEYFNVANGTITNWIKNKTKIQMENDDIINIRNIDTQESELYKDIKEYNWKKKKIIRIYSMTKNGNKQVFENIEEVSIFFNIKKSNIRRCCNNEQSYTINKKNKEMIVFIYEKDYKDKNEKEIDKILKEKIKMALNNYNKMSQKGKNNPKATSVICLTTKRIFLVMKEGAEYYNCNRKSIGNCCKGDGKSAGKLPDGTKLVWRYLVWNHNKILRKIG